MEKLPKRSGAKAVGNSAEHFLCSVFSRFLSIVSVPNSEDLGIDFFCELMDLNNQPTGQRFSIQCKGTDKIINQEDNNFSVSVKVTTANYWLIHPSAVFLIVVDAHQNFYWTYPRKQLLLSSEWHKQKYVSITFRTTDRFGPEITKIPQGMQEVLDAHLPEEMKIIMQALREKFSMQRLTIPIEDPEHPRAFSEEFETIANTISSIDSIQSLASIIKKHIIDDIIEATTKLRQKSKDLLVRLDYAPDSAQFWPANSGINILNFEFGAGSCEDIWLKVDQALSVYIKEPNELNYEKLVVSIAQLIQLNRDIYWTTKMLYDEFDDLHLT